MPMMQFSVAPWRVLDAEHLDAVKKAVAIRQIFVPEIIRLAEISAKTGEPIVRNLAFEFPGQGFEDCRDQFMLGENILVAPMVEKGNYREVSFPKGIWKDKHGKVTKGPVKKQFYVPLDELLWFRNN
jgi:alpha-glucosidase (family GH31 glycosyl hydrolase)